MNKALKPFVTVLVVLGCEGAHAQGIPVIDAANLAQTVQQVINDITKINNQVQQITFNNALLHNYVPAKAFNLVNAVQADGYAGLGTTAKRLRDAGMVYNCTDRAGAARTDCQASLAQPYQYKGLLQDAMSSAANRLAQIQSLMDEINATPDQKSVQEIQARIGAENALLAHESSQIQMLQGMADSEERIARSRDRERQYQTLGRAGRIADYLP